MKHVKIPKRAFIESTAASESFPYELHRLYVLIDDSGVARCVGVSKFKQARQVTHIRQAIRVACANMRERCAELCDTRVEGHAEHAHFHGWSERRMGHSDEASRMAAAIRSLDL